MKSAGEFLVYSCGGCGKRIFTERSHFGRTGVCPCCGKKHVVGGARQAKEAQDRRGAPRVKAPKTKIVVEGKGSQAGKILADELAPVGDLSETGVAFKVPGIPDRRQLAGFRPPALKQGDVLTITLHGPHQFKPRTYKAEVRRIIPPDPMKEKGIYTVGCQFTDLNPKQQAELKALVERLQQD